MQHLILFPHQLWFDFPENWSKDIHVILVEEFMFFKQYNFHKQKLGFHRASMKAYESHLSENEYKVTYIEAHENNADIRTLLPWLKQQNANEIFLFEPEDFLSRKRTVRLANQERIKINWFENQIFINSIDDLNHYESKTKKLFQTDFYIHQRKLRKILVDELNGPIGGKWSFDADNRKKYPAKKSAPRNPNTDISKFHKEAQQYVEEYFNKNYGTISNGVLYPIHPKEAMLWFEDFLKERFSEFGEYEDAIVSNESFLHHSVLTPMLNVGILKPMFVIERAIEYAEQNNIEINSLEGFVRQILGWREFVRYVYHKHGVKQRTTNFWGFDRKIAKSFYAGSTGIRPVDDSIKKLLSSGYNHHIERLMVLSNFMLLCEFNPDEVYRWFMELYIDAYDWVMVPNVYGMAQFSDGGMMVTKPYISGSNYIIKMSDYKKGEDWAEIWDALFWRYMHVNRDFFKRNPRLSMLINTFDKWPEEKKQKYIDKASKFLDSL